MDKIKIIREALQWTDSHCHGYFPDTNINTEQEIKMEWQEFHGKITKALQALVELETSMVSERFVDIPIANEELIKEIDRWLSVVDLELKNVLTQCKAHLSQVKPSTEEIRNKIINEIADSYHGEMANYFCKKANNEKLAGVKEDCFALADKHREYQNDIRNQVWLSDNLKP